MFTKTHYVQALIVAITVFAADGVRAESPATTTTTITCSRMCPKCGQKISERLRAMPGVADARTNVDAKAIVIVARPQHALSPRALWEMVENGGESPVTLQGPSGAFTQKPSF